MLSDNDEEILRELKTDFRFRMMEKIIKQFFTESLEAVLLKQKDLAEGTRTLSTIADIAIRFKVSKATVHNWLNQGLLSGLKVGKNRYFTEEEIRRVIILYKRRCLVVN